MKECAVNRERAVIANHQMPEVAEPREGALDFPAPAVAPQRSSVLGRRLASIPTMRRDQGRSRASPAAFAAGHCRNHDQRSGAAASAAAAPRGFGNLRGWSRASFPRAAFRAGMQNKGAFPKEDPGRRPPPSTSCPCPAWFFRRQRPFFGGSKTPVQERLAPLQLLPFVEFGQKRPPDMEPDTLLFPVTQSAPARGWRGELFGQILPASAAAQNPQNAFEHLAVGGAWPSAASPRTCTRKQGPDLLPLGVGQQTTVSRHRPSSGAADLVYLAFPSTQLPQNSGLAPSFETASSMSLNRRSPE